jgi:hypothetical protein
MPLWYPQYPNRHCIEAVSWRFPYLLVILPRIVQIRNSVRVLHISQPTSTRSVPRASGLVQTRDTYIENLIAPRVSIAEPQDIESSWPARVRKPLQY